MITINQNKFTGKRCFVIASGPGLKSVDLTPLKDEITICVNESYKDVPFTPTFICIGDRQLWPFVKDAYASMHNTSIIAGTGTNGTCGQDYKGKNLLALLTLDKTKTIAEHGFNWNLAKLPIRKGFNVITEVVLPFVCYAGFSECYLLGCDHKENGYAFDNPSRSLEHQKIDEKVFDAYSVIGMARKPTKIFNATEGSAIQAFRRVNLKQVLYPNSAKLEDYQFVGYYTNNQNYPELANRMKNSVIAQGGNCEIFERTDLAKGKNYAKVIPWVLNCSQCAEFCLTTFKKYSNKRIFYLDADAVTERAPELLISPTLPEFDFAAPYVTNKWVTDELTSNTLIFRRTLTALKILIRWYDETQIRIKKMLNGDFAAPYKEVWDQRILQDVLTEIPHKVYKLPWEYAKITVTPKGEELMQGVDPNKIVISQYQASRQNKYRSS